MTDIRTLLENVRDGRTGIDEAILELKEKPFEDIGFAKVDLHRRIRQGAAEVIYGQGKTSEQIIGILDAMKRNGQDTVLVTRLSKEAADIVSSVHPLDYHEEARIGIAGPVPEPDGIGTIVVATGGTSDIPVAEEAALTAEVLSHLDEIMSADVIIAIAGMEGALASVLGGLSDCPVIAVPTSVGYGAAFGGLAALLSMLNSCASGVSVVNIDNGFGAGYLASMINHKRIKEER